MINRFGAREDISVKRLFKNEPIAVTYSFYPKWPPLRVIELLTHIKRPVYQKHLIARRGILKYFQKRIIIPIIRKLDKLKFAVLDGNFSGLKIAHTCPKKFYS